MNVTWKAPYWPDLDLCDFSIYPRQKSPLREFHFELTEAIKESELAELKYDYFEGDRKNLSESDIFCVFYLMSLITFCQNY